MALIPHFEGHWHQGGLILHTFMGLKVSAGPLGLEKSICQHVAPLFDYCNPKA